MANLMMSPPEIGSALLLSWLDARATSALEEEKAIVKARNYHDGEQLVFLTDRLKQFLNAAEEDDADFRLNVCRTVVEALAERIAIKGWECGDKAQQVWAEQVWQAARMAAVSEDVHEMALRDGQAFVIVDWDQENNVPQFFAHPRYTSVEAGGDGFGCIMVYPNDDVSQPPLFAVKRWVEYVGPNGKEAQQRANFYFPERIEKKMYNGAEWVPVSDPGDAGDTLPWVASDGSPLGIPVIHFRNKGMRSEARDAIPVQDAINKTFVDLLAAGDLTAFRIYVALGFIPTTDGKPANADGSNVLVIEPGQMIGTTAPQGTADFKAIDGADLGPLAEVLIKQIQFVAMVTATPTHRFQISGLSPAEGTLKQQDEPLLAKGRSRTILFGDAWVDAMNMARTLANNYARANLDTTKIFKAVWQDLELRTDEDKRNDWETKQKLKVPLWQIWLEMGYTQEQVDRFMADPSIRLGTFASYPAGPTSAEDTLGGGSAADPQQGEPLGEDTVTGGSSA